MADKSPSCARYGLLAGASCGAASHAAKALNSGGASRRAASATRSAL